MLWLVAAGRAGQAEQAPVLQDKIGYNNETLFSPDTCTVSFEESSVAEPPRPFWAAPTIATNFSFFLYFFLYKLILKCTSTLFVDSEHLTILVLNLGQKIKN